MDGGQPQNRRSIRLQDYDYSQAGGYAVTICSEDRELIFGDVIEDRCVLSNVGRITEEQLLITGDHFSQVEIDRQILMPNHLHVIFLFDDEPRIRRATLGEVVGFFKYQSTKYVGRFLKDPHFRLWQRNYYEHVIRDESDLLAKRRYIEDNPRKWKEDEYYRERGGP